MATNQLGLSRDLINKLDGINQRIKYLIHGYIRKQQQRGGFYNIPPLIDILCLLYYHHFEIRLSTPNHYHYKHWFEVDQSTKRIELRVKATNDAHIALGSYRLHDSKHWEIVIGGWRNTQSVMRKSNQGRHVEKLQHQPLSGSKGFDRFWIEWSEKENLSIGFGMITLMTHKYDKGIPIKYMSVSTGWGSEGEWIITL